MSTIEAHGLSPTEARRILLVVSKTHAGVARVGSHRGRHRALRTYRMVPTSTVTALGYFEMCPKGHKPTPIERVSDIHLDLPASNSLGTSILTHRG